MNVILAERVILCQQITVQSPVLVNFIDRIRIRAISRQSDSLNDLNHSGGFCFLRDFEFHLLHLFSLTWLASTC
ncbi:hypothetical protein HMPREF9436_01445 [Faecalibacterium cf. prausnitzii KLE1255]|uniref:Uncharacterized protein n=1 Tax=Faecalibacterium cf. prausnitzii KLE1255 TaxID=748224 RepID=E2ZIF1_9FIRM|nr:hypothetical protein HMPREF9436_01445 [Faecalibacterium cf. prausnitzii KLE1255]